jgi:hypothetical protein
MSVGKVYWFLGLPKIREKSMKTNFPEVRPCLYKNSQNSGANFLRTLLFFRPLLNYAAEYSASWQICEGAQDTEIAAKSKRSLSIVHVHCRLCKKYVEYKAVSGVFQNIDPPPPSHPASVSSPHTRWAVRGVGGQYFERRQTWDWPLTV